MELLSKLMRGFFTYFMWYRVYLHMKSGKTLYMGDCKELNYKYDQDNITSIQLVRRRPGSAPVLIQSLILKQIEAISVRKVFHLF